MTINPEKRLHMLLRTLTMGWGTRVEVTRHLAGVLGLAYPSGSVSRAYAEAEREGFIITEAVRLFGVCPVSLVRLSELGREACRHLGYGEPRESEWERMIEGHQGDDQMRHTAAVLTFAGQARRRGWVAYVLPEMPRWYPTEWQPDLRVIHGAENVFVEVEMRARYERVQEGKFRRAVYQAQEMGAELGIVGLLPYARERFADWVDGALVTDLASLCQDRQRALWWQGYQATE